MRILALIARNAMRHRLRSVLTVFGIVVAILAFGLLQTVIDAWYAGSEAASANRLVTRNAVSLVFPMPLSYEARIRATDGVTSVSYANWFGGIYREPRNRFIQFAVEPRSYLDIYPEFVLTEAEREAFIRDRKGCVIGRKLADTYGFRIGDVIPIQGTIYPGNWELTVRGIFEGRDPGTFTGQMLFHWDYLNETLKRTVPRRANQVGAYIVGIANADRAAAVAAAVDAQFRNSLAETLTETEKSFQLGFVSMISTIVTAIRIVSFVVIAIIMAVMANTMAMSVRERLSEYATLKALGFGPGFLFTLIFGESIILSLAGFALGLAASFPACALFRSITGTLFPTFALSPRTMAFQFVAALAIGTIAALVPARQAIRLSIVRGLRHIG